MRPPQRGAHLHATLRILGRTDSACGAGLVPVPVPVPGSALRPSCTPVCLQTLGSCRAPCAPRSPHAPPPPLPRAPCAPPALGTSTKLSSRLHSRPCLPGHRCWKQDFPGPHSARSPLPPPSLAVWPQESSCQPLSLDCPADFRGARGPWSPTAAPRTPTGCHRPRPPASSGAAARLGQIGYPATPPHPLQPPFSLSLSLCNSGFGPSWGVSRHPRLPLLHPPRAFSEAPGLYPSTPGHSQSVYRLLEMGSPQPEGSGRPLA